MDPEPLPSSTTSGEAGIAVAISGGMPLDEAGVGAGEPVLGQMRDRVEQRRTGSVIEIAARQSLLVRACEAGAHFAREIAIQCQGAIQARTNRNVP